MKYTTSEIMKFLNRSLVQLPSIISIAMNPCNDKAGKIVYLLPRTNTTCFLARVFTKEYPYPRDKLRSSFADSSKKTS